MMTNDDGGFDPARRSLASVPDPGGSSDNAGAGFPSNDWGGEEDQEGAEEYHDGQYYEGEDGYEYGDDGDDGGYDEEYPAPQDARSAGGGVTFDQPYESAGSTSFRRRSRNHLSKVSRAYDTGGKGFLTPAEQHLRQMDLDGEGQLSNAAVATIMEGKLRGDEIINRLQRMLWMLGGMTLLLILANLGTAWAVAVMAKDTSLDSYSGEMYVKGAGGDGPTIVTTRTTGDVFVFTNFNVSARSLYVDDGDEDQEVGDDDDDQEDDSLFCITPENAARVWHDATTGTAVSAMFDFTPPTDYMAAADDEGSIPPPIDLNTVSLQADGAMLNETHACIGTGLPTSRAGMTQTPSFLCIELVSSVCDDMGKAPSSAGESSAATGTGPVADTATSNTFARINGDGEDGGSRRRMLFHAALRNLQSTHPNSFRSSASSATGDRPHLRRGRERELSLNECRQACTDSNKGKRCRNRCRKEHNRRRRGRKGFFQTAPIPRTNTINVGISTPFNFDYNDPTPASNFVNGQETNNPNNGRTPRMPVQAAPQAFRYGFGDNDPISGAILIHD